MAADETGPEVVERPVRVDPTRGAGVSAGARITRARALEAAALAVGGLTVGGVVLAQLPDAADSRPSAKQDATILNFALLLEYVQGGLYDAALRGAGLSGELRRYAQVVSANERAHAALLRGALGAAARRAPKLDFGEDARDAKRFMAAAVKLEDLGVEALNAQGPNLTAGALAQAARIVSVEARHAAWIRAIAGELPAPEATEPTASAQKVASTLKAMGYVG
jgi:Ferritin-like domain